MRFVDSLILFAMIGIVFVLVAAGFQQLADIVDTTIVIESLF